jgi:hypothetical protein
MQIKNTYYLIFKRGYTKVLSPITICVNCRSAVHILLLLEIAFCCVIACYLAYLCGNWTKEFICTCLLMYNCVLPLLQISVHAGFPR